jgi:uncharacterized coiled-coil protein SlyX
MTHFQLKNRFPPLEIKQAYQLSLLQELTVCQNSFQKKLSNKTNTDIDQKITQPSTNVYIDSSLLNSCLESLHTRLTRFIECQSFFTQCDIFNDILNDMSQVANTLATNPMYPTISFLTFCDCLIRLLVDLSSYQITLPRYRHYLTKVVFFPLAAKQLVFYFFIFHIEMNYYRNCYALRKKIALFSLDATPP